METIPEIRALTIEEITEAFGLLDGLEEDIGALPYRDGKDAAARIGALRDIVGETFPGGYVGPCEACGKPIGADQIAASDYEGGGHFCADCAPPPKGAAGAPDAADNAAQPEQAPAADPEGWIEWPGGDCPVGAGTLVDIEHRDGWKLYRQEAGVDGIGSTAATSYWSNIGHASDIVRYRLSPADRADGGADIITKHTEIAGADDEPFG